MKIKYLLCLLQAHALWKEINKFIVPLSNQCSFSCFSASQGHSHTLFYQFWVTRNPVLFLGFSLTHYFLKHYDALQVRSSCWIRRLVLYRVCLLTSNLRITFASISVVPEVSIYMHTCFYMLVLLCGVQHLCGTGGSFSSLLAKRLRLKIGWFGRSLYHSSSPSLWRSLSSDCFTCGSPFSQPELIDYKLFIRVNTTLQCLWRCLEPCWAVV